MRRRHTCVRWVSFVVETCAELHVSTRRKEAGASSVYARDEIAVTVPSARVKEVREMMTMINGDVITTSCQQGTCEVQLGCGATPLRRSTS